MDVITVIGDILDDMLIAELLIIIYDAIMHLRCDQPEPPNYRMRRLAFFTAIVRIAYMIYFQPEKFFSFDAIFIKIICALYITVGIVSFIFYLAEMRYYKEREAKKAKKENLVEIQHYKEHKAKKENDL